MLWQDLVITLANILFSYSLIYQVHKGFKLKKGFLAIQTSLFTSIGLYASSLALITLELYASSFVMLFNGILWTILLVHGIIYEKA